jgi:hypothetical protein
MPSELLYHNLDFSNEALKLVWYSFELCHHAIIHHPLLHNDSHIFDTTLRSLELHGWLLTVTAS